MLVRPTEGPGPATASRVRALVGPAATAAVVGAVVVRLHATRGIDVAPIPLCPLHSLTGLWCPFCGGLRAVAALSHGDLPAALSFNLPVTVLLPVIALSWVLWARAAWQRRDVAAPSLSNRGWLALGAVLLVFTVWRNLPQLPLGAWLAP